MGGTEEIERNIERIIKKYSEKGGVDFPEKVITKTSFSPKTIKEPNSSVYIGFFYEFTCKECERIFYLLDYLEKIHPNLIIKKFNLQERENKIIFEAIAEKINIPENKRLTPATLIIGYDYLQQKEITLKNIENLIIKYKKTGSECIWDLTKEEFEQAERNILARFKSFKVFTVIFAGLIDGINPCAFAVIVFFISYLIVIKKRKRDILLVGFSFMFAVFLVYFLIGYGSFSFLSHFTSYRIFSRTLNILVGSGAIIFGIFSFCDFLKAKQGKINQIFLQLPKPIKTKIHSIIIKKMSLPNYIFGSFLSGIIVSLLEFSCTGQVYLPTILFVSNQIEFKKTGCLYLFFYNLFFILPLFIILLLSYFGTSSNKISVFFKNNLSFTKFLLSLLFILLGSYLILNTF